ncbi:hypothetical protein PAMC26577_37505 [Caballeronia sordidicola]|uniref:Uncharacterized protein n=1 Tax=Caballeronia sordidicola TaxID=196367 RepID=A0A242M5W5_CABSO|nr:hypothetical protein PAMC26577_37505 [Caballeronia sordidicola]
MGVYFRPNFRRDADIQVDGTVSKRADFFVETPREPHLNVRRGHKYVLHQIACQNRDHAVVCPDRKASVHITKFFVTAILKY